MESALRTQLGDALERRAVEDLAAAWFGEGRISSRQAAALLGLSLFEVHDFLKRKGVALPMSIDEVQKDIASLRMTREA
ncbi:MAG TPA: UPF0175 family protein [Lacipirellula sp.]